MTLTPDTILTGTRVLAPFDGWIKDEILSYDTLYRYQKGDKVKYDDELTYHTSYDALHSAFNVFRDLDQSQFTEAQKCDFLQHRERIVRAFGYDSIEKCFSLLVDAVTWYEQIKKGEKA